MDNPRSSAHDTYMSDRSEQNELPEWTAEEEAAHQRWLRRAYPQRVQALQAAPPAHGWR